MKLYHFYTPSFTTGWYVMSESEQAARDAIVKSIDSEHPTDGWREAQLDQLQRSSVDVSEPNKVFQFEMP